MDGWFRWWVGGVGWDEMDMRLAVAAIRVGSGAGCWVLGVACWVACFYQGSTLSGAWPRPQHVTTARLAVQTRNRL